MAPHSSTLAWKIPWTEEPGRLQSMGSQRVRHICVTSLSLFTFMHWRKKWQSTPVFLPGESQGAEPGGLPSMGSHRVGHNWNDLAAAAWQLFLLILNFLWVILLVRVKKLNPGSLLSISWCWIGVVRTTPILILIPAHQPVAILLIMVILTVVNNRMEMQWELEMF